MPNFQAYLKQVKTEIRETSVDEVKAGAPDYLIDVRESDEYNDGFIPGALWIPRGLLELRIEDAVPDADADVVLYCAGGTRSALAAKTLAELGYTNVELDGGRLRRWKRAGLTDRQAVHLHPGAESRYARHLMLPEVGEVGQAKLLKCQGAAASARAASARRRASTSPRRASARSASSTTTWSTRRTCSGRSSTRPSRVGMPKVESAAQTHRASSTPT